uniref:Nicotinic acetylcholine receptor alpha4 variant B n=1 Tax=Locusta migratoria TaxID=7004 RepID=W6ECN0_LOCMI|nr:nicotinic acetylcholine receptor alpha4 variant B [Locusta migratoria]
MHAAALCARRLAPTAGETLRAWLLSALVVHGAVAGNPDAKRLYDDLLSSYNKLVRPVVNTSDVLRVCIKLKLSQLIDVNLKNQIMTTNLWVEQSWYDYKLRWEPKEYGGVHMLHVPSDHIWRPDIVLYNKWTCGTWTSRRAPTWSRWASTSPSSTCPSSGTSSRCLPSGTRSSTRAATSRTWTSRSTSRCAARRCSTR